MAQDYPLHFILLDFVVNCFFSAQSRCTFSLDFWNNFPKYPCFLCFHSQSRAVSEHDLDTIWMKLRNKINFQSPLVHSMCMNRASPKVELGRHGAAASSSAPPAVFYKSPSWPLSARFALLVWAKLEPNLFNTVFDLVIWLQQVLCWKHRSII